MNHPLDQLLTDGIIDEVLGGLKSGKEADVWLVRSGEEVFCAKVYKERHARNFKHNAEYKEGRTVRNSRTQRAMTKGSRFGQEASEGAWKQAETDALYKLKAAGMRVPAPHTFYEGILVMELIVDAEGRPAPRLIDAPVLPQQAGKLYRDLRTQIVTMLCAEIIHGDLSAYNVLMGAAGPTIIDFPQIISAAHNSRAEFFFARDINNIRIFLSGFDRSLQALGGDAVEIWKAYVRRDLEPDFTPSERPYTPPKVNPPRVPGARGKPERSRHGEKKPQPAVAQHPPKARPPEPAKAPQVSYRGQTTPTSVEVPKGRDKNSRFRPRRFR